MASPRTISAVVARADYEISLHRLRKLNIVIRQLNDSINGVLDKEAIKTQESLNKCHEIITCIRKHRRITLQKIAKGVQEEVIDSMHSSDTALEIMAKQLENTVMVAQHAPPRTAQRKMLWSNALVFANGFGDDLEDFDGPTETNKNMDDRRRRSVSEEQMNHESTAASSRDSSDPRETSDDRPHRRAIPEQTDSQSRRSRAVPTPPHGFVPSTPPHFRPGAGVSRSGSNMNQEQYSATYVNDHRGSERGRAGYARPYAESMAYYGSKEDPEFPGGYRSKRSDHMSIDGSEYGYENDIEMTDADTGEYVFPSHRTRWGSFQYQDGYL